MGLIWSIIIGAIAGCIASAFMNEKSGLIKNILLGILGGFVGGFLFGLIGFHADGTIARLVVSVIGACICIWYMDRAEAVPIGETSPGVW